jgi:hypothetical protein
MAGLLPDSVPFASGHKGLQVLRMLAATQTAQKHGHCTKAFGPKAYVFMRALFAGDCVQQVALCDT